MNDWATIGLGMGLLVVALHAKTDHLRDDTGLAPAAHDRFG